MYPINAAAVIIEERMHMTGEHYSVLCDSEEMIVAIFVIIPAAVIIEERMHMTGAHLIFKIRFEKHLIFIY